MRKSKAIVLSLLGTTGFAGGCQPDKAPPTTATPRLGELDRGFVPQTNQPGGGGPTVVPEPGGPGPSVFHTTQPPLPTRAEPTEIVFEPNDQWHDEDGNPIPAEWKIGDDGKPVPVRHPRDAIGRPWEYDKTGTLAPPPPVVIRSTPVIGDLVIVHTVGSTVGGRPPALLSVTTGGLGTIGARISRSAAA
jgi:hypothetical protein